MAIAPAAGVDSRRLRHPLRGAATTTVYPTTPAAEVAYILRDSGARVVFAEDDEQIAKLRATAPSCPSCSRS